MIGELQHLIELQLIGYENLNQLLQNIPSLFSLSMLDLFDCNCIQSLPTTIGELKHWMKLWLRGCEKS
jgi:hypothetical protein